MKHWTVEQARSESDVLKDVVAIVDLLKAEFKERGEDGPRVVMVGSSAEDEDDEWRYEVLTELAPGVLLPAETGYVEGIRHYGQEEPDEFDVVDDVIQGVDACRDGLMEAIADALHKARLRTRRIVSGWQNEGLPARLVDVRLAPYDGWRGQSDPALQVIVETLDDRLEPVVETVPVKTLDEIGSAMDEVKFQLEHRSARRAELAAKGASGSIDRLALNALASHGEVAPQLRRFGSERRFRMPDDTVLLMTDGHVSAGSGVADPAVDWEGDRIAVASTFVNAARLGEAVGRPATWLLDHPFLSDDMIVREARSEINEGRLSVAIRVDMPTLLFCSISGRVWEDVGGPVAEPVGGSDASAVVPFKRRLR